MISVTLPFAESPKFLISTNYTIEGTGGSHEDRIFEVEFTDHYNARHKPVDEFGHRFFDEWDDEAWNDFYNVMLSCLRAYLMHGLVAYEHTNLAERKLRQQTAPEFLVFMADSVEVGVDYDKKDLHARFLSQYPDFAEGKMRLQQRTLTRWIKRYATSVGLDVEEKKNDNRRTITLQRTQAVTNGRRADASEKR